MNVRFCIVYHHSRCSCRLGTASIAYFLSWSMAPSCGFFILFYFCLTDKTRGIWNRIEWSPFSRVLRDIPQFNYSRRHPKRNEMKMDFQLTETLSVPAHGKLEIGFLKNAGGGASLLIIGPRKLISWDAQFLFSFLVHSRCPPPHMCPFLGEPVTRPFINPKKLMENSNNSLVSRRSKELNEYKIKNKKYRTNW